MKIYDINIPRNYPFQFYVHNGIMTNICDQTNPLPASAETTRQYVPSGNWPPSNGYIRRVRCFPIMVKKEDLWSYIDPHVEALIDLIIQDKSYNGFNVFIAKKALQNDMYVVGLFCDNACGKNETKYVFKVRK